VGQPGDGRRVQRTGDAPLSGLRPLPVVAVLGALALTGPSSLTGQVTAAPRPPRVTETELDVGAGPALRYGISLPDSWDDSPDDPRPLVVALHPGGRAPYYGSSFMQSIVEPALRSWGAVVVAPDVPDGSWATARSERAVLALVEHVRAHYAIDPTRVLVTGYSMGGRGTWYMASRHPDVFTGAIVMAGSPGDTDLESLPAVPLYLINSPEDEVIPFEAAEDAYLALAERGHVIEMRVLPGIKHYSMGAYVPALRLAGRWMLERWNDAPLP
jgi:poly(3-hydroxybutyrate) depolymerase